VLLQTRNPSHPALRYALSLDVTGFTEHEMAEREALGYPPFGRIVGFEFKGPDEASTKRLAERWTDALAAHFADVPGSAVLGPSPAFVGRVKAQWRFHTLLKTPRSVPSRVVSDRVRSLMDSISVPASHRVNVDVDPVGLF
jgi:primosomal protein N' (replication factor Y)